MKLLHEDAALRFFRGDALATPVEIQADHFIIDPPYARAGNVHTGRVSAGSKLGEIYGSDQFWAHWFGDVVARTTAATKPTGHGFVFCDYRTMHLVERCFLQRSEWTASQCLVWDREGCGMGSPFRASHELIAFVRGPEFKWTGRRDLTNVIRCRWPYGAHPNHEAEKPVDLLVKLMVDASAEGSLWLDNFAGSASSGIAARKCGRRWVGIEADEERSVAAVARLVADAAPVKQLVLAGLGGAS